jgi:anti-sigma regulatory factor (Ser/Thr protein kinase)
VEQRPPEPRPGSADRDLGESCRWPLPHDQRAACDARRAALAALESWGIGRHEDCAERTLLVVSELVTNAVEHALPPIALCLRLCPQGQGVIRVAVDDGGAAREPGAWVSSCTPDEHGRGTLIVDAVATAHGIASAGGGQVRRWADVPTP